MWKLKISNFSGFDSCILQFYYLSEKSHILTAKHDFTTQARNILTRWNFLTQLFTKPASTTFNEVHCLKDKIFIFDQSNFEKKLCTQINSIDTRRNHLREIKKFSIAHSMQTILLGAVSHNSMVFLLIFSCFSFKFWNSVAYTVC